METARTFTTADVAAFADVSYRMIDYWARAGLIGNGGSPSPGSGHRRYFSSEDVLVAAACAQVSKALQSEGTSRGTVSLYRSVAEQVRAGSAIVRLDLGHGVLLTIDTTAALARFASV